MCANALALNFYFINKPRAPPNFNQHTQQEAMPNFYAVLHTVRSKTCNSEIGANLLAKKLFIER